MELRQRKEYLKNEPVETIYFGGGTPSQLSATDYERILDTINQTYGMSECKEITIEVNPDDINYYYLKELTQLPFNRISIGIQTFNDSFLSFLNRRHSSAQAIECVKLCKDAGFENISIDLMYGLPNQTLIDWSEDIDKALEQNVQHISAYHLIYEEGTRLWKMKEDLHVKEASEENSLIFFKTLIDKLKKAGFIHYEISNFALPGRYSKHNSSYWIGKNYLGCGASAHSFDGTSRQWNVSSLQDYVQEIENQTPEIQRESLDADTQYNEFIITSLRTMWGLSLGMLTDKFGEEMRDFCLKNAKRHLDTNKLSLTEDTLKITEEGIFISDIIMSDLLKV